MSKIESHLMKQVLYKICAAGNLKNNKTKQLLQILTIH